ncbi:hypothetical protein Salat_0144600 [Sesamum alatum]|uniref:Uncharacterized protein n=1 Tax=Sesamum alatum TaxID=300844 RepID=A0AAE1YWJ5_9LAMI|nr:hypothetical protein Salat_0144600 [Sesamum alatum]
MPYRTRVFSSSENASPVPVMASSEAMAVISGNLIGMCPLLGHGLLNALPPLNLGDIKRVMKEVGLVDHEFNAKAILDEELLIVVGLHPAPDRYEGPHDRIMMNRVAVRKFIPDDVPAMPSSSGTRSAPSTPSDLPPKLTPTSRMTHPPSASLPCHQETPVIEVVTSPEDASYVEDLPSSHKRPRIDVEGTEDVPTAAGPSELAFLAPVLTPHMDPQVGAFNMSKAVNRADVEVLTPRTFTSISNLILSNASVRQKLRFEPNVLKLRNRLERERENKHKEELDALKHQMVDKDSQISMLTMENVAIKASTMQAYARGREEGASSAVLVFKESAEYADEMYRQASAYYVDSFLILILVL